jgi:hypothetical protein
MVLHFANQGYHAKKALKYIIQVLSICLILDYIPQTRLTQTELIMVTTLIMVIITLLDMYFPSAIIKS